MAVTVAMRRGVVGRGASVRAGVSGSQHGGQVAANWRNLRLAPRLGAEGSCCLPRLDLALAEEVLHAVALFAQLLLRRVHPLAAELINRQALNDLSRRRP